MYVCIEVTATVKVTVPVAVTVTVTVNILALILRTEIFAPTNDRENFTLQK
jgi:hypothetical protein